MHFEGEFRVPGKADEVIHRFADVPRMARCMPGAVLEPQAEDGSWPGAMVVAFGPKKINFKGRVTCEFDFAAHDRHPARPRRRRHAGRADRREGRLRIARRCRRGRATTMVKITSDAELGGVLADFARTGGVAVANVIMADFARRAAEEFAKDAPATVASADVTSANAHVAPATEPPAPAALSAHGVLWKVIIQKLRRLAQRLGLRARQSS